MCVLLMNEGRRSCDSDLLIDAGSTRIPGANHSGALEGEEPGGHAHLNNDLRNNKRGGEEGEEDSTSGACSPEPIRDSSLSFSLKVADGAVSPDDPSITSGVFSPGDPSASVLVCVRVLEEGGDSSTLPHHLHQIAETLMQDGEYERAIRYLQLERLYHERVLSNIAALQDIWESRWSSEVSSTTLSDLESEHLDRLKHICKTHRQPTHTDQTCDALRPCEEEKGEELCGVVEVGFELSCSSGLEMLEQDELSLHHQGEPMQCDSTHSSSQAPPTTPTTDSSTETQRTGGGATQMDPPTGVKEAEPDLEVKDTEPDSPVMKAEPNSPVMKAEPNSPVMKAEPESALKEAGSESALKEAGSESALKEAGSESALKDTAPDLALKEVGPNLDGKEVEPVSGLKEAELSSIEVMKEVKEETPAQLQDEEVEQEVELDEEEVEEALEALELEEELHRSEVTALDDLAKRIQVEEISPAVGLVSILKRTDSAEGSRNPSERRAAKRRVHFHVPEEGLDQDEVGGDSWLLLLLLCLVTVVISVGGTALYCAMGDAHSSVCTDFSHNVDFYLGKVLRGVDEITHLFSGGS